MPAMKNLPIEDLVQMAQEGKSSYQIADELGRDFGIDVSHMTIQRALEKAGHPLHKISLREHPLIRWNVTPEATLKNIFRMLTLVNRMEDLPTPRRRQVERFLYRLHDSRSVIHYDERHPNLFFTVPIRPGIDDIVRLPNDQVPESKKEKALDWDRRLGITKLINQKIKSGEIW